ncbi:protein of unknown function [Lentzea fradiae]|uniref:DUF4394 domain-containing protein n=1 Tax=Lentzea fradiae TaxID=200378 RepID=A0A1G7KCU8_9PSEU|nr:DUF4394 domain-containing protein [Lentzea fradiae]SDF34850.1 protein of unknown function [Lentzea fradiae]
MRARAKRGVAAAAVVVSVSAAIVGGGGSSAAQPSGLRAYGITADGTLMVTFTTDRPTVLDWVRQIQGFSGDAVAAGIDIRPQDGLMYLLGDKGGVYTVKLPASPSQDPVVTKVSQLSVPLYGTNFGVDFNPAADRLRVISDTGQNLRHNLADHTTTEDAVLSTPPALGPTRGVTAAAYTNNDLNPDTATTLFDIGTASDEVLLQVPANNGLLSATGKLTVDAQPNAGFDIYSQLSNGKAVSNSGFAALSTSGAGAALYSVNLLSGEVTSVGRFPLPIADLAISLTGS